MSITNVKQRAKQLLYRRGYHLARVGAFDTVGYLEPFLYALLGRTRKIFFIEIGANDGKSFDPIYQFVRRNPGNVSGIVVEPMRDAFVRLRHNYRKYPNVTPVNAAIHNSQSEAILYRVDPERAKKLPKWAGGIASFKEDHHTISGIPRDYMIAERVRCISLEGLLKEHQVAEIDLLQVDTEGYDSEIITSIDFQRIRPKIIHFEHGLKGGVMGKETFLSLVNLLHTKGYEIFLEPYDAMAYELGVFLDLHS